MRNDLPSPPIKNLIKGSGLTKPGVVILQFLFIFVIALIEIYFRANVGFITGISIWISHYGALIYGRPGTAYVAAVNPPISFTIATLTLLPTVGGFSLSLTRLGIDLVTGLASVAPFLITGALFGWFYFFKERKRSIPRSA